MRQKQSLRLIVIDESLDKAETLVSWLRDAGYGVHPRYVDDPGRLADALVERCWDMVLLGRPPRGCDLANCLGLISSSGQDLPAIVVDDGPEPDLDARVQGAVRAGAHDLVRRREFHVVHAVGREVHSLADRRECRTLALALKTSEKRYCALIQSSSDAIAYVREGAHLLANPAYLKLFGYAGYDDIRGRGLDAIIAPADRVELNSLLDSLAGDGDRPVLVEVTGLRADQVEIMLELEISPATLDGRSCWQVRAWRAQHRPPIDPLHAGEPRQPAMGLEDREHLFEAIDEAIAKAGGRQTPGTFLCLQIDNLSALRATAGLQATMQLVAEIALLLTNEISTGGRIAQLADDAFGVLLRDIDLRSATGLAETLRRQVVGHAFTAGDDAVHASCSVGIVRITDNRGGHDRVLENAYKACWTAQKRSEGIYLDAVAPEVAHLNLGPGGMARLIDEAMDKGRLNLVFQPILRLNDEPPDLYEVFLRMRNEAGEEVPPSEFFPAAREAGLITKLDRWIMDRAISVLAERHEAGQKTRLFVKLSSESIRNETVLVEVARSLRNHRVSGSHLIVEISETAASGDINHAKAFLSALHDLGCTTAIEHFGTGLSSFRLLEQLPVDYVKIDSALIADIVENEESAETVKAIVGRAKAMGKQTIAERLANAPGMIAVVNAGVDYAQGFYIQEPRPTFDFDFPAKTE